jgi:hypothetical protein
MTSEAPVTGVSVPKARIASTLFAIQYVPAIAALGPWALVAALTIGSANQSDAVFEGYIVANTMTVTAIISGTILVGGYLTDSEGAIINATQIISQPTGSPGGTGTYTINNPQTVSGATFTGTGSGTNMTAASVIGVIEIGDILTGTGVPANTKIVSQTSGPVGGAGVYVTNNATTSAGASIQCTDTITAASPIHSSVVINGDQVPQLVSANIQSGTT